jgi:hypothetical protein
VPSHFSLRSQLVSRQQRSRKRPKYWSIAILASIPTMPQRPSRRSPPVVRVTDLYSPGRDTVKNAGDSSVAEVVRRLGITGATFADGHGSNGKQSDLHAITAQQERLQAFGNLPPGPATAGCHFLSTSNPI